MGKTKKVAGKKPLKAVGKAVKRPAKAGEKQVNKQKALSVNTEKKTEGAPPGQTRRQDSIVHRYADTRVRLDSNFLFFCLVWGDALQDERSPEGWWRYTVLLP